MRNLKLHSIYSKASPIPNSTLHNFLRTTMRYDTLICKTEYWVPGDSRLQCSVHYVHSVLVYTWSNNGIKGFVVNWTCRFILLGKAGMDLTSRYLSSDDGLGFSRWENFQINTRIARINGSSLIITLSFPFQIFEKMLIVVFIISFSRFKPKKVPNNYFYICIDFC